jgi:hypothetical protein
MLKKILFYIIAPLLVLSCNNSNYPKALDPIDGGRGFIENMMQGDVKKAHFYIVSDSVNERYFKEMAAQYFSLDKEGRQQLRTAAIQINEVSAVDSSTTIINYQNSLDQKAHKLKVIQTLDGWKVDLKYTYGPNL